MNGFFRRGTEGQVSAEAVAAVAILLMVLLLLYANLGSRQSQIDGTGASLARAADCSRLGAAIALVQSAGANAGVQAFLGSDANLSMGLLSFGGYSCYIAGSGPLAAQLHAGNLRVSSKEGAVAIENL